MFTFSFSWLELLLLVLGLCALILFTYLVWNAKPCVTQDQTPSRTLHKPYLLRAVLLVLVYMAIFWPFFWKD